MLCRIFHTTVFSRWNLKNRFILAFFQGLLVTSIFYTAIESRYESTLFEQIVTSIASVPGAAQSKDSFLLQALHASHQLLNNRQPVFNGPFSGFKTQVIYPVTFDLMTANGACGSYARVLARILQTAGVKVRFAEMEVHGQAGGHIIIEAQMSTGWVVLDPLYDLYFTTPRGTLASFSEVQKNWSFYKSQTPVHYNLAYNYEGVRYTNWDKIPVLLPMVKKILQGVLGKERTEHLSLRTYFLQPYHLAFYSLLCAYTLILLVISYRWLRTKQLFPPIQYFNRKSVSISYQQQ